MSRLANPEASELRETKALRDRRDLLLRKANQARFRLHCRPDLTKDLQQATNELLRLEIEARAQAATPARRESDLWPEPDCSAERPHQEQPAAVSPPMLRLPYKD
ncbi:hypothetical protein FMN50_13630 [Rhodobacterales bacterium]|nr:hypothetical protein FMN50_13630 [Rhodobacterales bacterium]